MSGLLVGGLASAALAIVNVSNQVDTSGQAETVASEPAVTELQTAWVIVPTCHWVTYWGPYGPYSVYVCY